MFKSIQMFKILEYIYVCNIENEIGGAAITYFNS